MRVLLTGSTGMVGAHTAAALHGAGHELRLLVRDPRRIARALDPLGVPTPEHVTGDVTDAAAVERALDGCDAAVHAAALLSFDHRRDAEMQRTNVEGTRLVLGTAARLALDPILYVSSLAALFPPAGDVLTADETVKRPRDLYARSKASAERLARDLQDQGAPVVISYPGWVVGPDDPTVNDGVKLIFDCLKAGAYPVMPGGVPTVDVRDVAAAHAAAMKTGRGPRRYVLGGHFLSYPELVDSYMRVTGRRVWKVPIPGALMRGLGRRGDALRRLGVDVGAVTYESMLIATRGVPCDSSPATGDLGIAFRPTDDTLRDVLLWMHRQGLAQRRHLGTLIG
jgi:dihydroflavonol-4-reductase